MQSAGRDGRTGMGAKGLSGEGYEGHYFWDTEMYVLPVFVYTDSELAKQLLNYRYATLNQARDRAKILGHMKKHQHISHLEQLSIILMQILHMHLSSILILQVMIST